MAQLLLLRQVELDSDRLAWPESMQASIVHQALRQHELRVGMEMQRYRVNGEMQYRDVLVVGKDCVSLRGTRGFGAVQEEIRTQHAPQEVSFEGMAQTEPFPEFGIPASVREAYRREIQADSAVIAAQLLQSATVSTPHARPGQRL